MSVPNPLTAVTDTAGSRKGLIALALVALGLLWYEAKSGGKVTGFLAGLPLIGGLFKRG